MGISDSDKTASLDALAALSKGLPENARTALSVMTEAMLEQSAAIGRLAKRLQTMEKTNPMFFAGPYIPSATYSSGAVVQRANSCWIAMTQTTGDTPGTSDRWRRLT